MGLLDQVLGAATQAMGGQGGKPDWPTLIANLLMDGSAHGGLAGVLQQLRASGLGEQVQSWVSTGANMPVSGDQISSALGGAGGLLGQLAQQAGVSHAEAGSQLSQLLPMAVDLMTPHGQVPDSGSHGSLDNLTGLLGGLLSR